MIAYNTICSYSDEELYEYPHYLNAVRVNFNIPIHVALNLVGVSPDGKWRFQYYFDGVGCDVVWMNFHSWEKYNNRIKKFELLSKFGI